MYDEQLSHIHSQMNFKFSNTIGIDFDGMNYNIEPK